MSRPSSGSVRISRESDYEAYLRGPNGALDSSSAASLDEDDHHSSEDGSYGDGSPTGRLKKGKNETRDEGEGPVGSSDSGSNNTSSLGGNASQQQRPKESFVGQLLHSLFSVSDERYNGRSNEEPPGPDGNGGNEVDLAEGPNYLCTTRRVKWFIVLLLTGAGIGVSAGAHQVVTNSEAINFSESVSRDDLSWSVCHVARFLTLLARCQYSRLTGGLEKETAFMTNRLFLSMQGHSRYVSGEVEVWASDELSEHDTTSTALDNMEISVHSTTPRRPIIRG
jgi:hypothetical protein